MLVNVTGGLDMTLLEVDEAANAISDQVDPEANIIFGAAFDPSLDGKIRVSVVATGMDGASIAAIEPKPAIQHHNPPAPLSVREPAREPARQTYAPEQTYASAAVVEPVRAAQAQIEQERAATRQYEPEPRGYYAEEVEPAP